MLDIASFDLFTSGEYEPTQENWLVTAIHYDRKSFEEEVKRQIWKIWRICKPDQHESLHGEHTEFLKSIDNQIKFKNDLENATTSILGHLEAIGSEFALFQSVGDSMENAENHVFTYNIFPELSSVCFRIQNLVSLRNKIDFPQSMINEARAIQIALRAIKLKKSDLPIVDYVAKEFTQLYDNCSELCRKGMKFKKYTADRNRFLKDMLSHFGVIREDRTVRKLGNTDNPVPVWMKQKLQ